MDIIRQFIIEALNAEIYKTQVDPKDIQTLHSLHHSRVPHMEELAANMKQRGWDGRPIAAIQKKDGTMQAMTGTHRISAARLIDMPKIPVVYIKEKDMPKEITVGMLMMCGNYDRAEMIKRFSPQFAELVAQDTKWFPKNRSPAR